MINLAAYHRLLTRRWARDGRCPALHPTDRDLHCVEAPGHGGDHHCEMSVRW